MDPRKIGVLFGGTSQEREVSIVSAEVICAELKSLNVAVEPLNLKNDVVRQILASELADFLILLHGGWGEDGTLQAFLDLLGARYSGSRHVASTLAANKALAKTVFERAGVPTPQWHVVTKWDDLEQAISQLPLPWVRKPLSEGSSIGVELLTAPPTRLDLEGYLAKHGNVMVERYVAGHILTVAILDTPSSTRTLKPIEIQPTHSPLYDRNAKTEGRREYILSPSLPDQVLDEISELAYSAHRALGCCGVTRVDLMFSEESGPAVLEVNTTPGMGPSGNLITSCESQGISRREIAQVLVETIR